MGNIDPITLVIIAINVLFSMKGFDDFGFFEKYKFNTGGVRRGEQVRIVINGLGEVKFIIIYLGSLILGNLLSYFFHKDEYHYSAVGASGAVSGILYAAILLQPGMSLYMFFIPIPIPAYIFGIGYLLYSIYGMRARRSNIGHDAHFGGAVGGYIITLAMVQIRKDLNSIL